MRNEPSAGSPACPALLSAGIWFISVWQLGRQGRHRLERGVQLRRGRVQLVDQRLGVGGEATRGIDRRARLGQERRERADRVGQRRVAVGRRLEQLVGVAHQPLQLRRRARQCGEHLPAIAQQRRGRRLLAIEHRQHRVDVGCERVQLRERGVELLAPVGQRDPSLLHPCLERPARLRAERVQDLIELDRGLHLALGQLTAVTQLGPVRVARRQLHVGLAQQRLLRAGSRGYSPAADRTDGRPGSPPASGRCGDRAPPRTRGRRSRPRSRTCALGASSVAWLNSTLNRYPWALNGRVPPNEIHRKISRPTHEAVNATIVTIARLEGRCLFTMRGRSRGGLPGSDSDGGHAGQLGHVGQRSPARGSRPATGCRAPA